MTDDELLQPTVTTNRPDGPPPWRLKSQFWVAFLGGAVACAIIAIPNAGRLGMSRAKQWMMAGLTLLTLAILFAVWLQQPYADNFMKFMTANRDMRLYSRFAAVLLYLALAAMQRKADAHHQVFAGDEYASLWNAGAGAVIVGALQPYALAYLAWAIRA